jgi:hypothetical protein
MFGLDDSVRRLTLARSPSALPPSRAKNDHASGNLPRPCPRPLPAAGGRPTARLPAERRRAAQIDLGVEMITRVSMKYTCLGGRRQYRSSRRRSRSTKATAGDQRKRDMSAATIGAASHQQPRPGVGRRRGFANTALRRRSRLAVQPGPGWGLAINLPLHQRLTAPEWLGCFFRSAADRHSKLAHRRKYFLATA